MPSTVLISFKPEAVYHSSIVRLGLKEKLNSDNLNFGKTSMLNQSSKTLNLLSPCKYNQSNIIKVLIIAPKS